jgi:hypothetical protein
MEHTMADPTPSTTWPQTGLSALDKGVLAAPIVDLLEKLHDKEIPKDDAVKPVKGTDPGVQVITAGATSFAKWYTVAVASVGGIAAVGAAVKGFIKDNPDVLFPSAIIIAATAIAIAIMVSADVAGRAKATSAKKQYHSHVVEAFLNNYQFSKVDSPVPAARYETNYAIRKTAGGSWIPVEGLDYDGTHLIVKVKGDLVAASEVKDIIDLRVVAAQINSAG